MPRPQRLDYPGAWFHVTARGNERRTVFIDDGLDVEVQSRCPEGDLIIGSERFVKEHAHRARLAAEETDVPRRQQAADRPSLDELFRDVGYGDIVKHLAVIACQRHGHSFAAVARKLGVHYTTVSRWTRKSSM